MFGSHIGYTNTHAGTRVLTGTHSNKLYEVGVVCSGFLSCYLVRNEKSSNGVCARPEFS